MEKVDFKNLDKKSKVELAITCAAVIILIIALSSSIKNISRKKKMISQSVIIEPAAIKDILRRDIVISSENKQASAEDDERRASAIYENMPWGRDPFIPWDFAKDEAINIYDITLEGIMWDEVSPTAVINGSVYEVGDDIKNMRIIKIRKDSILLREGDREYNIKLR